MLQANDRTTTTTRTRRRRERGHDQTEPAHQLDSSLQHGSSTSEIFHEEKSVLEVQQDNNDDRRKKRRNRVKKGNRQRKKPKLQELDSSQQSNVNNKDPSTNPNSDCPSRNVSKNKPLSGMTISVSTLQTSALSTETTTTTSTSTTTTSTVPSPSSYQQVCEICRELGATISKLVSKRIDVVVCSPEAVQKATQRVRKAIKRNKPIVSLDWIYACRRNNTDGRYCKVDMTPYRLEKEALNAMEHRLDNSSTNHNNQHNTNTTSSNGQSTSQENFMERTLDLGCCCVCHEQGTTNDCPWCQDCPK
ncbi:BRCA1 C Terminus BRCT domain containing protein [Nitzschia inconspicua]|uniref:BRCA1 C Terminus BRCT domain containing protein n=1 Tax=Nitzschia inconspicua TaxID=303405 RepID=A0A9K3M0S5_9STRA|nr:BRCA1 C Terminus BRCT domain containing protein [Nitzschia inconspicua]